MAYIELPISHGTPHQSFSVQLDGSVYQVRLRFNSRAGHWAMDLADAGGTPLALGIAVRLGVDLLAQYSAASFPPGVLFALNWTDQYQEPDRKNMGSDVSLIFEEAL